LIQLFYEWLERTSAVSKFVPREYQSDAIAALLGYFESNPEEGNPLIGLPTGTGKSWVIALFCLFVVQTWPTQRVIVLTHSSQLVRQNAAVLRQLASDAPVGLYAAQLQEKRVHLPITMGTIQSAARNPTHFQKTDIVLIDEAHRLSENEETQYGQFLKALKLRNPRIRIIGLSATCYRAKQGLLTDGNGIFTEFAYDKTSRDDFNWFIDEGYLAPLRSRETSIKYDTSKVGVSGGDFQRGQLENTVNTDELNAKILENACIEADDKHHWLIYCAGIKHVEDVVARLKYMGQTAVGVHSKMDEGDREDAMNSYHAGEARMLVSMDALTTGFDSPHTDCIVLMRPTRSPGLHVQILGRGTRPDYADSFPRDTREQRLEAIAFSEKTFCRVLDYAGNIERLGPINDPVIPPSRRKKSLLPGEMPIKICPVCGEYNHTRAVECSECGHVFVSQNDDVTDTASNKPVIATGPAKVELMRHAVQNVEYSRFKVKHRDEYGMLVVYHCGNMRFMQEVFIESTQKWRKREAEAWWFERLPAYPPPPDTLQGLTATHLLLQPKAITVKVEKGKHRVKYCHF
jgi:DNA repair protein RadD